MVPDVYADTLTRTACLRQNRDSDSCIDAGRAWRRLEDLLDVWRRFAAGAVFLA